MKVVIYANGDSYNHGCEALTRTLVKLLDTSNVILRSRNKNNDILHLKNLNIMILDEKSSLKKSLSCYFARFVNKLFKKRILIYKCLYKENIQEDNAQLALSVGGDNYCGYGFEEQLKYLNKEYNNNGAKTALIGCSIEPELLKQKKIIKDMNTYSFITARESITYRALKEAGIKNLYLIPDSAFMLEKKEYKLPSNFLINNTVGINVSPLIQRLEKGDNITFKNYERLIQNILNNTDMNIALIPHVVWNTNNDLEPLTALYNKFASSNRVCLFDKNKTMNCMELKYVISKCRFMVTARTHASIASYSTCVPTLVVGYSIKAKGIAKDLFGTYENYVLPVQSLKDEDDLSKAFEWLLNNEKSIKSHLEKIMPDYIEKAKTLKNVLGEYINEN